MTYVGGLLDAPQQHDGLIADKIRVAYGVTALRLGSSGSGIDGIGHYTACLKERLLVEGGIEILQYAFENIDAVTCSDQSVRPVGRFHWQAAMALLAGASFSGFKSFSWESVDLVHATDHQVPKLRNTPVIATLMDAIPLSHPQWVNFSRLEGAAWRRSMQWADRIVTISEHSREAIVRHFGIEAKKIDVVPLGVESTWFEPVHDEAVLRARVHYSLPERFFLFVGTLQPRKNLQRLIQAHTSLPESVRRAIPLMIVGRYGWGVDDLAARLKSGSIDHIRWLDYVPREDLKTLVAGARALVFPSLAEGFGLPVLEAFAAGTAVIASKTTSLPEVAGAAGHLVDPESVDELRKGLLMMAEDDDRVREFEALGRERARLFTWENTARQTIDCYRKLL